MGKLSRILAVIAACPLLAAAHAEDTHGPRIVFPVVIDPPAQPGGDMVKPRGIAFQQSLRSGKAIRLSEEHVVSYLPRGEKSEVQIKLPAQTLFVLARDKSGEMYCTALPQDANVLVSMLLGPLVSAFQDAGICVRDSNFDGKFDEEIVIDQSPARTRIAYEIIGTGQGEWKPASLAAEQVDPAQIPAAELHITYDYFSGGLFGKRHGMLHFMVCWPQSLLSSGASDGSDKACANLRNDARGNGFEIGAGDGAHSLLVAPPFDIEMVADKDNNLKVTMKQALPAGPGVLVVSGRVWVPRNPKYQRTIIDIFPGKPIAMPAI
jgi:hypothetical protein